MNKEALPPSGPDGLLEQATLLQRLYRSGEAGTLWERLLEHHGADAGHLLAAARQWFQAGRFRGAARFTARALAMEPWAADTAALHAAALERAGEVEEAERVAAEMLERHPGHARLVRQMARIERRRENFEAARKRLEEQLRRYPGAEDWRLRYELAAVLDRTGDFAGAMRELELAKRQLLPEAAKHRPLWRAMSARQREVMEELTPERLARWQRDRVDERRICLMAGFPRSGTTLLERVLVSHRECIGTDESGVLATQFRDPIVFGAGSSAEVLAELDAYEAEDLAAGRAEYFRCTADVLGEEPGERILIEKDPLLTPDLALPLRLFPDAKILMPLRDPRDVLISFYFTIVPLAPNSVAAANPEDSCLYLEEVMGHWLFLRERLAPERWMESRYEDLLAEPEQRTRELACFLGLDWREEMLAPHRHEAVRGGGTPTYEDVSKPLYTRARGRWRNYQAWLEPHMERLEPLLDAFGYPAG